MTLRNPFAAFAFLMLTAACAPKVVDEDPSGTGGASGSGGQTSGTCVPQCVVGQTEAQICCGDPGDCGGSSTASSGGGSGGSAGVGGSGSGGSPPCWGGDYACVTPTCALVDGCPTWTNNFCETPLVLVFDAAPVELVPDATHAFTLSHRGSMITDWPTARTPWLALDRDRSGSIDDGSELFGSMTSLPDGRLATNGFEALRALDTDGDGQITASDRAFADLVLWADGDGDRQTAAGELTALDRAGIVSIDLRYVSAPRCDARGNCEVERAPFQYRDAAGALRTGEIVDVHLRAQR
jgi:hypothetical protein